MTKAGSEVRLGPFHELEQQLGAVFGEVCGWEVPVRFERGSEHLAHAHRSAGIVDLTPMGRLKVTGQDRVDLLQRLSTNDLKPLAPGRMVPTLFTTAKGRILDRVHVLDRGESILLLTSPAGRERLPAWLDRYIFSEDVGVTDVSRECSAFAVAGPAAGAIVREVAGVNPGAVEAGRFLGLSIEGVETLVSVWDELPSAWLFLAESPGVAAVFGKALAAGEPAGVVPIGVEEADVLRIEAGIPAEAHELTEEWNPWEVRLESSFSLTKGCYTGQEVIARLATYEKVQRHLIGLRIGGGDVPIVPQKVYGSDAEGEEKEIGVLTSAVRSDCFGGPIGLAVVRLAWDRPGAEVAIGEQRIAASVSPLPFV